MISAALVLGVTGFFGATHGSGARTLLSVSPVAVIIWLVLLAACGLVIHYQRARLLAVIGVGVIGLIVAAMFVYFSAPDLAMTQIR